MPTPVRDQTLDQFLAALGSADPVPGGGAAAALAGALAASLLAMVLSLALKREGAQLEPLLAQARGLRTRFLHLADEDVAAYGAVAGVLALPRGTEEEKAHRKARLQAALLRAAEVPVHTAQAAVEALELAAEALPHCPRAARSDLLSAVELARAAGAAALANVDANALALEDGPARDELARTCQELAAHAQRRIAELLPALAGALASWRTPSA
ncbi:MAG: cyclodeaminase/cyclohydrolase family protein [Candidatus Bipolaricaulota bacterium]|nr:cyclodeaminase/cyclohydrolase family protein [Candidatus Bipolaricaulota bacterium]